MGGGKSTTTRSDLGMTVEHRKFHILQSGFGFRNHRPLDYIHMYQSLRYDSHMAKPLDFKY